LRRATQAWHKSGRIRSNTRNRAPRENASTTAGCFVRGAAIFAVPAAKALGSFSSTVAEIHKALTLNGF